MAVYKTVDPDESPDRIKGYTGVDPEYQNRVGAVFSGDEEAVAEEGPATEAETEAETEAKTEAKAPVRPEAPKS